MKGLLGLGAFVFLSSIAAAAPAKVDACQKFVVCGSYEGGGQWYRDDGQAEPGSNYLEKLVVTPIDESSVSVKSYVYGVGQAPEDGWSIEARFVFEANGRYKAIDDLGELRAAGVCHERVCSFSYIGRHDDPKESVQVSTNVLRFESGKVRRFHMLSNAWNGLLFQRTEMRAVATPVRTTALATTDVSTLFYGYRACKERCQREYKSCLASGRHPGKCAAEEMVCDQICRGS